jgi:2'-5' RNA ligase
VDASLAALGFAPEARSFSAHVTLGRVREPRRDPELTELLVRAGRAELGAMRVDRVVLMQSQLSPRGARYSELGAAPLAAEIARETQALGRSVEGSAPRRAARPASEGA